MILIASDVESLARALGRWEVGEWVCAGVVALAVAGEYIADFTKWFSAETNKRLAKKSTLVLIVALIVEAICLVRVSSLSGQLVGSIRDVAVTADSNARAAVQESSTALTQAKEAGDKAAAAKTSARGAVNDANQATVEAKRALGLAGEVGFLVSARRIMDREPLLEKLRQFKGVPVTFTSYAGDPEGNGLCAQLVAVAKEAEMRAVGECEQQRPTYPTLIGITVQGPDDKIMESLGRVLGTTPYLGGASSGPFGKVPHRSDLLVFIGWKSPFSLELSQPKPAANKQTRKARPTHP